MTQNNKQKIGSFPGPFANQRGPFLLWTETRDWSFILKWNRIQGLSKKESKLHSTHRCRSRHVFGGAKDFVPKLARKVFGKLYVWVFPSTQISFGMTSKKSLLPTLGVNLPKSNNVGRHF